MSWRWLAPAAAAAVIVAGIWLFSGGSIFEVFRSEEALRKQLAAWGVWAPLGFIFLNTVQVILAWIPGTFISIAAGYVFGLWTGFLLNITGIMIGSYLAFALARRFGRPLVYRLASPRAAAMLERVSGRGGARALVLIFLLPFLPSDAACLFAGLTPMRTSTFMWVQVISRPPAAFAAALTGAGLLDLPIWGWAVVVVLAVVLFVVWWRWGERVEDWVRDRATRLLGRRYEE